ncbi:MAG: hypothetical protein RLZZ301_946 [Bacteroidota bacterium]
MSEQKPTLVYFFPHASTFIKRDLELLANNYNVIPYLFAVQQKKRVPFEFMKQAIFCAKQAFKASFFVCHFAGYASLLPVLLGRLMRKKVFVIVAGNDASCFRDFRYGNFTKPLMGWATKTSLRYATRILPVAQGLVHQRYSYYPGGAPAQGYQYFAPGTKQVPFTVIPYGFNTELFRPDAGVERPEKSFISIGNLSDPYCYFRKGFDLILAYAKLHPTYQFTLVGWENSTHEVPSNVRLIGFSPIETVIRELQAHRYYFQLSVMEGFPNALGEAMACGCVPIGSAVSGIPELIGDTGVILHEKNLALLSAQIESLLSGNFEQQSAAASARIAQHFLPEHRLAKLNACFQA